MELASNVTQLTNNQDKSTNNFKFSLNFSREIQLLNSSDEDTLYTAKLPVIKKEPALEKLQNSAIYQSIKQASGFKADNTSPDSKWSLLNMLSSRQVSFFN